MKRQKQDQRKKTYVKPSLKRCGTVRSLTASGSFGNPEGGSGKPNKRSGFSDLRMKQNIFSIGEYRSGIHLYCYEYLPEYQALCGSGKFVGVLAQQVEQVMPDAVSTHATGFKQVDYTKLGLQPLSV
ncbi:MAG: tail fiber domain-containing protein [bacterium]